MVKLIFEVEVHDQKSKNLRNIMTIWFYGFICIKTKGNTKLN